MPPHQECSGALGIKHALTPGAAFRQVVQARVEHIHALGRPAALGFDKGLACVVAVDQHGVQQDLDHLEATIVNAPDSGV